MVEGPSLNETKAVQEAILAREAGINLLVVGVSVNGMPLTEWMGVASYPNKLNVFTVADYDQIGSIVNRLITSVNNGISIIIHHSSLYTIHTGIHMYTPFGPGNGCPSATHVVFLVGVVVSTKAFSFHNRSS